MFKKIIYKHILQKKYKKKNKHNFTWMNNIFDFKKVKIGKGTYGPIFIESFDDNNEFLEIGNYCSIASEVKFILGGEHNYKLVSTYPFKNKLFKEKESFSKGKIIIEDDVWIGYGTIILSGVTIGQGAIIGAGSVVRNSIPPYAIYADGRILKYRFSSDIISELKKIDFSKINSNRIKKNLGDLYNNVTKANVNELVEKIMEDR